MKFIEKISADLTSALKKQDKERLNVLRAVKTALKNKSVELKRPLDEKESIQIVNTLAKQRRESIEQFAKGGRQDLVKEEELELTILVAYLPPQLSEEDLTKIVKDAISETGASSMKDMGAVMKAVMGKTAGRADGKVVSSLVNKLLQ